MLAPPAGIEVHVCFDDDSVRRVVAFSDDGQPMVVDLGTGSLVQASRIGTVHGVDERAAIVGVLPCTTWYTKRDGLTFDTMAYEGLGWLLRSDGSCARVERPPDRERP